MVDSPYLVEPGKRFHFASRPTDDTGPFKDKEDAKPATRENLEKLDGLQEVLYAESKRALLVVFQAMDCGGKDGAIEHVFSGLDPQGCAVTNFKVPTSLERSHDFLWRHHLAVPGKGMIGIHNRSHYESVLVERVKNIVPKSVWSKRYDHINEFERILSEDCVTIIKFCLHISKAEQKRRLEARRDNPAKQWKFNPADLEERKHWDAYQDAFQDALRNTSTKYGPWYVVPADRKWFRNWVVSDVIVRTLKRLKPQYPPPVPGIEKIVIR
jgi:PPK2 family polyphosphate:nucleotide phosphotransferase